MITKVSNQSVDPAELGSKTVYPWHPRVARFILDELNVGGLCRQRFKKRVPIQGGAPKIAKLVYNSNN